MTFWEFLVRTFQGQTNRQWWWHPKVVPMMILCFQKDFISLIDLGTIKKRNFWKIEKSYGNNFGNIVRTSFVWGKVMNLCRTTLGTLGGMSSLTETSQNLKKFLGLYVLHPIYYKFLTMFKIKQNSKTT
jgi:hypothetical protein